MIADINSAALRAKIVIILAVASAVALAAACDSEDDDGSASPTLSDNSKSGPLALGVETKQEPTLVWHSSGGVSSYHLMGTLRYGPTCDAQEAGLTDFETITLDEEIDGSESEFALPRPSDQRLEVLLGVIVSLQAGGDEEEAVEDSIAYTADPICE